MKLTVADVNRLIQDPSPEVRAETAAKVAETFVAQELSRAERALAEAIFRTMLRDAEVMVRKALAESLKVDPSLPRDVALALARDVAEVAEPILEFSRALSDEDLIEILRAQSPAHQLAVARREAVTPLVAGAVAELGAEEAVAALMNNRNAAIPEKAFQVALDRFGGSERVKRPMAMRASLPITVAERLVTMVSEGLREHLVANHELSPDIATDIVLQSRERATVGLSAQADRPTLARLVDEMKRNGRLTHSIIVRALCTGDLDFFETAMAAHVGIPVENAWALIHDRGGLGLDAICRRCEVPEGLMPLIRIGVAVARELSPDGMPGDRERFRDRVIERVLTHLERDVNGDNIDYLIGRLAGGGRHAA
ncbi:MAG: DUF2336 domain-containing protein [Alphaproteobacteria bacterium]|nr:DUF2336 domain-containing protein [Alphaproteobacteria bacterium]